MNVIGLDIGTSGVKSTVFDEKANVVSNAYAEYDLICERPGMYELDPVQLREKSIQVLKESIQKSRANEIQAICVTSFGESFVCLDQKDNVLCNTMIYMDKRGVEECEEFKALIPPEQIFDISGHFVDPMLSIYKMKWIKKHKPEIADRTSKVCFIADYIAYCLGAEHLCDYSLASRTSMFDVRKKCWWNTAVEYCGFDETVLPKPVTGGSITGFLSKKVAKVLEISGQTKLIIGGHDQILAAVGGGVSARGDVVNGMGTVDCMIVLLEQRQISTKLMGYSFPVVPYVNTGQYVTYAFNMSGGCIIKWFRDNLAQDIKASEDAYQLLNKEAPECPTNLIMLPYLVGAGTPTMDAVTPGVVAGLRYSTGRGELFRAFLEGESYEMKLNLECLKKAGIDAARIITVGGGSGSDLWMQLRADIFEKTVETTKNKEAGTLGSAILCYVNSGCYSTLQEAQTDLVRTQERFEPNMCHSKIYRKQYQRYIKLYDCMKEIYV